MTNDTKRDSAELDAIVAELEELGEGLLENEEVERSGRFGAGVDSGDIVDDQAGSLSILRLKSASATLDAGRSESLLGGLMSQVVTAPPEVARELQESGGPALSATEWRRSQVIASAVDGLASSSSSMPDEMSKDDAGQMKGELEALARLRVSAAELTKERSNELLNEVVERSGLRQIAASDNVVHLGAARSRSRLKAVFAAAAVVLLLVAAAVIWKSVTEVPRELPTTVAQIELTRAEDHLNEVEKASLKTLLTAQAAPPGRSGDHFLRSLREARSDALRARSQARVRRL